ncbi:hypothetical protein OC834_003289 [Tilletia horrida]|uniref:Uncharacterized protein n=1 Tax=Tilletia horrida TaxID=155126 RepID=A0AAN6JMA2_9BASI|nr:hypothetical protein OC834_003289 [Tilletia horrida]KAK0534896.1 hypothetical protein OC842_002500 [Tilletia horrida]
MGSADGSSSNERRKGSSGNEWLIAHDELPGWAADNHFIVKGYRRPGGWTADRRAECKKQDQDGGGGDAIPDKTAFEHSSYARCWRSMWAYWHNETVNIHTHFWGALFACALLALHVQHLLLPSLTPQMPVFLRYMAHAPIFYPASLSFSSSPTAAGQAARVGEAASGWFSLTHVPTETSHPPDVRDVAGFGAFFLGAVLCFGFSATFHCCGCHSRRISASFNKLD